MRGETTHTQDPVYSPQAETPPNERPPTNNSNLTAPTSVRITCRTPSPRPGGGMETRPPEALSVPGPARPSVLGRSANLRATDAGWGGSEVTLGWRAAGAPNFPQAPCPPRPPPSPPCDPLGLPDAGGAARHGLGARPPPGGPRRAGDPAARACRRGARRRGPRSRARLPAAARLPARAGARGQPRAGGSRTKATTRTGPGGRALEWPRGRGRPGARWRPRHPPPPLPREPPGPQQSRAALMNGTRRRRRQWPSGGGRADGRRAGPAPPRDAALRRPLPAVQEAPGLPRSRQMQPRAPTRCRSPALPLGPGPSRARGSPNVTFLK